MRLLVNELYINKGNIISNHLTGKNKPGNKILNNFFLALLLTWSIGNICIVSTKVNSAYATRIKIQVDETGLIGQLNVQDQREKGRGQGHFKPPHTCKHNIIPELAIAHAYELIGSTIVNPI